jgi:hypothetical protein
MLKGYFLFFSKDFNQKVKKKKIKFLALIIKI